MKKNYSEKIKKEAIVLADKIGVKKAAEETGVNINTLRAWRYRDNGETNAAANAAAAVSMTAAVMLTEAEEPNRARSSYKKAFKKKALRKSDEKMRRYKNGVRRTAIELGINYSTLAGWRTQRPKTSRGPQGRPVIRMEDSFPEKDMKIAALENGLETIELMSFIQEDLRVVRSGLNDVLDLREALIGFSTDLEGVAEEKGIIVDTPEKKIL